MYKTGTIYKIIDAQSDTCYVGMTLGNLANRMQQHKQAYDKDGYECTIYKHMREHGVERFKMIKIKEYQVVDRKHLAVFETLWIKKLKCINKNVSFNPIPMKYYYKQYQQANKEWIAEKKRAHYVENKERINAKHKVNYQTNRETIIARALERIQCVCGIEHNRSHKSRHLKSAKHQQLMEQQA
ncbi:hypothetical protein AaE_002353 [Aphanomyces astaci]|uniref:GIY-YIG domain-containing protein n=1 Tax=Aphanomyces astaci TaxID=112090 RepID=A0A6A5AZ52_APHAT|nr:hypothetical protein AaE_002353 [Aphanomyces astaci]